MTGASLSKTLCVTYDAACWGRLVLKSCMQWLDLPAVGAKQQGSATGRHCSIMGHHSGNWSCSMAMTVSMEVASGYLALLKVFVEFISNLTPESSFNRRALSVVISLTVP